MLIAALFVAGARAQDADLYDPNTLRTFEIGFSQPNWWNQLEANYDTGIDIPADLTVEGVTYLDVGVHFKGNSSYALTGSSLKKSFSISMDAFVSGQDLLGYDSLNFNNCFMDPTFMRETLTSHAMYDYIPTPRANFVKLIINGEDWGIYSNCEQVDGRFVKREYGNSDGNRYKATEAIPNSSAGDSALVWLGSNPVNYQNNYSLKNPGNPNEWIDLVELCDALNNSPITTLEGDLAPHLCIDDALWLNATSTVFADPDSYIRAGEEYFLYRDSTHDQFRLAQYDLNESFGASTFGGHSISQRIQASPFMNEGDTGFPLMNRLLSIPELRQDYCAHIRTLLDEKLNTNHFQALISDCYRLIQADVQADPKRLYSYSEFIDNLTITVSPEWWMPAAGLKEMVEGRHDFLSQHPAISLPAPEIVEYSHSPLWPSGTDSIQVLAKTQNLSATTESVQIRWRVVGPYVQENMFDDGLHGDGAANDGVWGISLPPQPPGAKLEYILRAASDLPSGGAVVFSQRNTVRKPHTIIVEGPKEIRINEVMASNKTGITDETGKQEDWIELHNMTNSTLDISGCTLSDDISTPGLWALPAGTSIPAAGHLLIWADDDPQDGPLHANFKLNRDGEEVFLHHSDGRLLDFLSFGPQGDDISTGRLFEGQRPWVTYANPTPIASNEQNCGYRSFGPPNPLQANFSLEGQGQTSPGSTSNLSANGLLPGSQVTLVVSRNYSILDNLFPEITLLIDPTKILFTMSKTADGNGQAVFIANLNSSIPVGAEFWCQAYSEISNNKLAASNCVQLKVCP